MLAAADPDAMIDLVQGYLPLARRSASRESKQFASSGVKLTALSRLSRTCGPACRAPQFRSAAHRIL
jgi:hypothetical protein